MTETTTEPVGRYEGDLFAVLSVDPLAKKPYRVEILSWGWRHRDGAEELGWRKAIDVLDGYYHVKEFRRLSRAVRYLYDVRGAAELGHIIRRQQKAAESRREVLS